MCHVCCIININKNLVLSYGYPSKRSPWNLFTLTSHLPNYVNNTAFLCFTSLSMKTHKCVITTAGSVGNCILESPTLKISRGNVLPDPFRSSCLRHERCKSASWTSASGNSKCHRIPCLVISNGLSPMRHVRQIAYVRYIKILTCLQSFLVIFLIIILFGFLCNQVSSGNCETMESWTICNFDPKAPESC